MPNTGLWTKSVRDLLAVEQGAEQPPLAESLCQVGAGES